MIIYKPKEFAEKIGVTVRTLQQWDRDDKLIANRNPKDRRYYTHQQYIDYIDDTNDVHIDVNDISLPDLREHVQQSSNGVLRYLDSVSDITGRDDDLKTLSYNMNRLDKMATLLIANSGVGKSTLCKSYPSYSEANIGKTVDMFQLDLKYIINDGYATLMKKLESILGTLKQYEQELESYAIDSEVVLFIDDIHQLMVVFNQYTNAGDSMLRELLERIRLDFRLVATTTQLEYSRYIGNYDDLDKCFNKTQLKTLPRSDVLQILKSWLHQNVGHDLTDIVDDDTLHYILDVSQKHLPNLNEPMRSLNILTCLHSIYTVENRKMDKAMVQDLFLKLYNIDCSNEENDKIEKGRF